MLGVLHTSALRAEAHGMHYTVVQQNPVISFETGFSSGDKAAYAECTVFPPKGDVEFQNGRTDANGMFSFTPNEPGNWRVVVNGGMGHRIEFTVPVALENQKDNAAVVKPDSETPKMFKAGFGLSLLANLGLAAMVLRRKK